MARRRHCDEGSAGRDRRRARDGAEWRRRLRLVTALGGADAAVPGAGTSARLGIAFAFPLALSANIAALVATAYAGFYATGRRAVGLTAAAALAIWPLLSAVVAGQSAWENGTWLVDTGLALYTEPLSTALVTVALALVLRSGRTDVQLALAGVLLSYATFVKLTNGFALALAVVLVAGFLGLRRALPLVAGSFSFVPALAAYWPIGYVRG
ncbi:MAG: hypothetical protein H0W14_00470, partial [Actinobacteria bacterium]|nr:hypothetical protein [Actinomycetota bacterium]